MLRMYEEADFPVSDDVKAFRRDCDGASESRAVEDGYVSPEWVSVFEKHKEVLKPMAQAGDMYSQYSIAVIYMLNLLHSDMESARVVHEEDAKECTRWLLMSAKQGFLAALDNLLSVGVGPEADRVRALSKTIPRSPDLDSGDVDLMRKAATETMKELYGLAFEGEC